MNTNKRKQNNPGESQLHRIHFEFTSTEAVLVCIAGTFNDWQPQATPMIALGKGRWAKDLVLPPGIHEYRLVVDGHWIPDPRAMSTVPNHFGGVNSICTVGNGA